MEKKYYHLLLMRKEDVIDLFKHEQYKVYCPQVEFDGNIAQASSNEQLAKKLLDKANSFDYSIEYYLVQVESKKKTLKEISIGEVAGIYALNQESFRIGLHLDPPIVVKIPIWEKAYDDFQINRLIADAQKGVENVFQAFEMEKTVRLGRGFITKDDIETTLKCFYSGTRPRGKLSIWTYLLLYERHQNYPDDNRGFFLDALHAYGNYTKAAEIDASVVQGSKLGKHIYQDFDNKATFEQISYYIRSSKVVAGTDKIFKNFFTIAFLFLRLKKDFEAGLDANKLYYGVHINKLKDVLKQYGERELKHALYLLGLTLGWDLTYKYIYRISSYPILKKTQQ